MTNAEIVTPTRRIPSDAVRWNGARQSRTPDIPPAMVEFRALGPVEALVDGRLVDPGTPKQRAVLALLVSQVGQPLTVDVMLEELWAGQPPPSATTSLQAYVANLRRVLEPDRAPRTPATVLRTRGRSYLLDSRVVEVDVHQFDEYATAGRQAWDQGDPQQALHEFEAGLALWRGQAYAEVADATYVEPEVARLEELRLSVVEGRCAALLAVGGHEVAVAELEAFVQAHPLREYGCELLCRALYRSGRQADALAVLRTNQKRLADELGIAPKPELQHLEHEILNQAPSLDWRPTPAGSTGMVPDVVTGTVTVTRPVRPTGAPPAPPADDDVFVGREKALEQLHDALATAAAGRGEIVAVSGEPGSGKTSLLRRFAEQAGVPVLWGVSPEHVAVPPLWPWEQVLRAVATCCPQLSVPGLVADMLDGDPQRLVDEADMVAATLRQFEAIVQYLTGASHAAPLVVVLDHLHRADQHSLRLLSHLVESVPASRLLVAASYQSGGAATVAETSAALARAGMTRIELDGLDVEDTRALASTMLDREVGTSTAKKLWDRTEGNPFFLRELIKQLTNDEYVTHRRPVPAPIRDVVLERVAQLPQAAADVLSVAAIAGRDFDIDIVAEASSLGIEATLELLDLAAEAGLIAEDEQRLGWFRFTHALTAEVLDQTTGRLRRARLHRHIAATRNGRNPEETDDARPDPAPPAST